MKKRVLSLFLVLTLCLTLLPTAAFAEGKESGSMSGNTTIGGSESGSTGGGVYTPPGSTTEGGGFYTSTDDNSSVTEENAAAQIDETYYATLPAALDAAQNGDTVKLLKSHTTDWNAVEAGEAQIAVVKKQLTLDLNGKTVDYLAVGEVVPDEEGGILESTRGNLTVMGSREGTGSIGTITTLKLVRGTLSVQDGANIGSSDASSAGLICEADSGAVTISGGTVYGANIGAYASVTVSGGTEHAGNWCNSGTLNITGGKFGSVKFQNNSGTIAISGGTFNVLQNLDNKDSDSFIPPMSLLKNGYAFYQDNTVQDGSRVDFLQNVTVKEHTHTVENDKCACGASSFVVTVTASGSTTPVWYTSLDDALDAVKDGDTVTLQGDAEVTEAHWLRTSFTLELNGKTATLQSEAQLSICAQSIIQDSSDGQGKMVCNDNGTYILNVQGGELTIKSGTFAGKITAPAGGKSKLTIEGGTFNKDVNLSAVSASLSGGSFTSIWQPEGSFLDRLADGYAFYDNNGNLVNAAKNGHLNNVKVQSHTHSFTDGVCACGYTCPHTSVDNATGVCTVCEKQFAASVTVDGTVTYYDTFDSALVYATKNNGCTLKLLADVTGTTVGLDKAITLDLNGHSITTLSVTVEATLTDSAATKGKIGTLSIHNTDPEADAPTFVLGDLVTGGDSFKTDGTWLTAAQLFGTSATDVSVAATGITGVTATAPASVIYGQTGTDPITLTVTHTDIETLTFEWFEQKDNDVWSSTGTGGDAYNPAALNAGSHTIRCAVRSTKGYVLSDAVTVTVAKASIAEASVTLVEDSFSYTGMAQRPEVESVIISGTKLIPGTDYSVTCTSQTDVGSYTLTVNGMGNYTGKTKDVEWKIEPMKIKGVKDVSSVSKDYDGSADVTLPKTYVTFLDDANKEISLPENAFNITKARFTTRQDGFVYEKSPNAGTKEAISFTLTLTDSNYAFYMFDGETESVRSRDLSFEPNDDRFTINQATVTPAEITQLVFNDLARTYTLNLAALLPELSEGCEYGDIKYQGCNYHFTDNAYLDSNNGMSVSKEGILTLPTVSAHTSNINTQIGTITVPVATTNYQKFEFTIKVVISARIPLNASGVTVSASEITYGQTLNESKLTATGTMKHPGTGEEIPGTFAWKNGTIKPNAGSYDAEWTFTPAKGYEEYTTATGKVIVKVNKADPTFTAPTANTLTYTGSEQSLLTAGSAQGGTMMYRLGDSGEFVDSVPTRKDAGTYTVYYKVVGDSNHNDTDAQSVSVTIAPLTLYAPKVDAISKSYDGTANVAITKSMVKFFDGKTTDGITLPDDAFEITNARFTMRQEDGESYPDSPEVGNGKSLSFHLKLTSSNYVLYKNETGEDDYDSSTSDPNTYKITKANAPSATSQPAVTVINGLAKTYEMVLSDNYLPKLSSPCEYGNVSYSVEGTYLTDGYKDTVKAEIVEENGQYKLKLTVPAVDYDQESSVGTLDIKVVSDNYQDFTLTIGVKAKNKTVPVPDGTISASDITYGQALNDSKITGKMKDSEKAVDGTFTWVNGTVKPDANDSYRATWKFTPNDQETYAEITDTMTIKVKPATPTGAPGYTKITTAGKTLKDAELTLDGGTLNPNVGRLEWVDDKGNALPDDTRVEANTTYKWRFTPTDTNYTALTGEVELYHRSGGSSTTAPVITVPVSSDKETVKVDASVSGGVATVKVTDRQLEQVTADTDTVTVDVSGLQNVSSAKLPSAIVEKAEQSGAELTVALPTGTVTLDAAALAAVGGSKDVTVSVQEVTLTDAQRDAVGTLAQVAAVVDVNVTAGTAKLTGFNGGKLTVSIPYTLKAGEDPAKLQVWFIHDDGSIENKGGSYDSKTGCFVFSTEHLSRYLLVSTAGTQRFSDVPASAYYAEAVAWAVKNGITGGTSATTFAPDGFCTRAQAVTFLWRAAGSPAPKSTAMPFTDVPAGSYYYDAVLWAIENGITKGTGDTTFSPNANCSRGQIVTFLWRSQKSPDAAAANPFTDVAADAYYTGAVLWAVEKSITGGTSATMFSPGANCTRAQIVTFIYRCMK